MKKILLVSILLSFLLSFILYADQIKEMETTYLDNTTETFEALDNERMYYSIEPDYIVIRKEGIYTYIPYSRIKQFVVDTNIAIEPIVVLPETDDTLELIPN